jgi:CubicO group peptidase (beta-lactamase class C family)
VSFVARSTLSAGLGAALLTTCAAKPAAQAPPVGETGEWVGRWVVSWDRPGSWRPPTFNGTLTLAAADPWTATLSFSESVAVFEPATVAVSPDAVRLRFSLAKGDAFLLDLFRDEDQVHGLAQWLDATGKVSIPWSPVHGQRGASLGGPLVDSTLETPWTIAAPAEVGLDEGEIRSLAVGAQDMLFSGFVLVKDGRLVVATGHDITRQTNIASVAKALSSLAVPFLLAESRWPSIDASVAPALGWSADDPRAEITLRHVMSHTTGLETPDYRAWITAASVDHRQDLFDAKLVAQPGEKFAYSNRTIEIMSEVVAHAAGVPLDEYLRPRLLVPLDIEPVWWHDPKGHARVHAGVAANALELAKVGVLLANDGQWEGRQVLPAGWTALATGGPATGASAEMGLAWFLLPDGGFRHSGDSGAFVLVLPRKGLVAAGVHTPPYGSTGGLIPAIQALECSPVVPAK